MLKQHETTEKKIGGYTFYITPFPSLTAANISGELAALLAPALGGLLPVIGREEGSPLDIDVASFSGALSGLSGDKVEVLLKKLLTKYENISVEGEGVELCKLTNDVTNEIFCGEAHNLFVLAVAVINVNFKGFFGKAATLFGSPKGQRSEANATPSDTVE